MTRKTHTTELSPPAADPRTIQSLVVFFQTLETVDYQACAKAGLDASARLVAQPTVSKEETP